MSYFDINNLDKQIAEKIDIRCQAKALKVLFKKKRKKDKVTSGSRQIQNHRTFQKLERKEKRYLKKLKRKAEKAQKIKQGVRAGKETKKYHVYILSDLWKKRKNEYYRLHGRICEKCGTYDHIDLHHAVYADFGNEKDAHLYALCRAHHQEFHDTYGVKSNMLKETQTFVCNR